MLHRCSKLLITRISLYIFITRELVTGLHTFSQLTVLSAASRHKHDEAQGVNDDDNSDGEDITMW